jgi:hypothetical protein
MPAPVAPKPGPNPKDNPDLGEEEPFVIEGPPDESLDEKYNKRMEFPLALVSAVLIHVVIGAVIIFGLLGLLANAEDKSGVPMKLIAISGMDDSGMGSAGSGGEDDPFIKADNNPDKALDKVLDPNKLPEVKQDLMNAIKYVDPAIGNLPISDANARAYESLNKSVRDKLIGRKQGAGPGKGSGYDGTEGKGPGGTGADSTLGRNMRWVLRFRVSSGRDYLDQLKVMGAEILVPYPNSDKCLLIANLNNLDDKRPATDDDMRRLSNKIKFSDSRPEAVKAVSRTLGLDFSPESFWAFFPKTIEDDLATKETTYRNKRAEDIDETIFRVSVTGSSYEFIVDEQKLKR